MVPKSNLYKRKIAIILVVLLSWFNCNFRKRHESTFIFNEKKSVGESQVPSAKTSCVEDARSQEDASRAFDDAEAVCEFVVRVKEIVSGGDGSTIYVILAKQKSTNKCFEVFRSYEDIEWLEHCLLTQNQAHGSILPPLFCKPEKGVLDSPTSPPTGPQSAPAVPSSACTKFDIMIAERYFLSLLTHPVFSRDICLERFLVEKQAPPHGKFKKGFLDKFTSVVSEKRKSTTTTDYDEFFVRQKQWNYDYKLLLESALKCFMAKIEAREQLASVLGHFSAALSLLFCQGSQMHENFNNTIRKFSGVLDALKEQEKRLGETHKRTLSFELKFYTKYLISHKETINRRHLLLVDFENSTKVYDKAKQNKRDFAKQMKQVASKSLKNFSESAKTEFKRFHKERAENLLRSIKAYAVSSAKINATLVDIYSQAKQQICQEDF